VILAGTVAGGGLYRSSDNGATWSLLSGSNGLPAGEISSLIADPNNANRFYAGLSNTGIYHGDFDSGTGIITWTDIHGTVTGLGTAGNIQLAVHNDGGNTVLFALVSGAGLSAWRTPDGATNWTELATPPAMFSRDVTTRAANIMVADPTDNQVVYITTYGGGDDIYRYNPAGAGSWVLIDQAGAQGSTAPPRRRSRTGLPRDQHPHRHRRRRHLLPAEPPGRHQQLLAFLHRQRRNGPGRRRVHQHRLGQHLRRDRRRLAGQRHRSPDRRGQQGLGPLQRR
ncbi:MAG: hypothetical protein NT031_20100, partial [Planctomycetota bacterium]|nr:hypothetical protein [Planctomycetota bacterium]